jgi:hypothetical protein
MQIATAGRVGPARTGAVSWIPSGPGSIVARCRVRRSLTLSSGR